MFMDYRVPAFCEYIINWNRFQNFRSYIRMKIVAVFSILIPGMSLVLGLCLHPPVHRLASACSVRNLTVTDAHLRLMTNDYSCNNTISKSSYKIEEPFKISFTFQPMPEYRVSVCKVYLKIIICLQSSLNSLKRNM